MSIVTEVLPVVNSTRPAQATGCSSGRGTAERTGAAAVGLSLSHISSCGDESVRGEETPVSNTGSIYTPPQLRYAVNASLVKVSRGGVAQGGGKRGAISGRSSQSRRRLLDTLHSVNREAFDGALFVALTYPDEIEPTPAKVKRDLDRFGVRLRRRFPRAAAVWSAEPKPRQSGQHVGKIFWHYHLIIFGVGFLEISWLSRAWFEIVGSDNHDHLQAGTRVERLKSSRQGIAYVAKYVSKNELAEIALTQLLAVLSAFPLPVVLMWWQAYIEAETGRTWGAFGREFLPVAFAYALLTIKEFFNLRRQLRHFVKAESKRRGRKVRYRGDESSGVTAYVNDQTAVKLLLSL